jgi:serine protease Do
MKSLRRLLAPCLLVMASAVLSAPALARPDRLVQPIRVAPAKMETLTFANLLLRAPAVPEIGLASDTFRVDILEELRQVGHNALGAENLVFGQDSSDDARFVLGGTIRELECHARRHCSIGIEWELLDRTSKKVVYKVMTRAGERDVDLRHNEGLARDLVRGALHSLLARPRFVSTLEKKELPPAQASGMPTAKFLPCTAPELALPQQVESAMAATVVLENDSGHGSGVIISPDGLLLTAAHVAQNPGLKARLRDGSVLPFKVVRIDLRHDIAVGRLEGAVPGCLPLRATPISIGEDVFAIGAPADKELAFSLTRGIVSGMREHQGVEFLQTDASINRGNSGGPLIDKTGRVVAVVSWKVFGAGVEGLAFGVPVSHAMTRLALEASAQTDESLMADKVEVPAPQEAVATVEDGADPYVSFAPKPRPAGPPRPPAPGWARGLRTFGFILLGTGTAMGIASWASVDQDSMKHEDYVQLRRINDAGWVMAGAGVATVVVSYALPSMLRKADKAAKPAPAAGTPAAEPKPQPAATARVGLGSVSLQVRF